MESRRVLEDGLENEIDGSSDPSLRVVRTEGDTTVVTTVENLDEVDRLEQIVLETESVRAGQRQSLTALKKYSRIGFGLAASDLACVILAILVARFSSSSFERLPPDFTIALMLAVLVWVPVFYGFGLYSIQHLSASEEFRRVIGAASLGVLLVVVLSY